LARVRIESVAYGGDAIARLEDGRTAFVAGGCPGDVVEIDIVRDCGSYVKARVIEVHESSASRVTPPCPYYGECGGCTWQHLAYDMQLTAKRQILIDTLERIGKIADASTLVSEAVASPLQLGYRNKIELVANTDSPRLQLGFHRQGSTDFVAVEECLLLPKRLRKAPRALAGALRYAAGESDLGIQRVGLRVAAHTKDVEPALWTSPGAFPRKPVASTLNSAVPSTSVVRVLTKGPAKERRVSGVEVLAGKGMWREKMAGYEFLVSAPSFFQVNTKAAEKLVAAALEHLEPDGSDRVLDLYSGVGTFTLPMAAVSGEVVAVESAGSAVRDLRRNLESQQLWADVVGGDASRELPTLGQFDIVLVDPPRSGLTPEAIAHIAGAKPRAVGYVSCDPSTFARDAATFATAGYRLVRAIPFDLFPQTHHVETLGIFDRV
jgi:23S rRNA (uracil1939-C5)-methyltransferase